MNSSMQQGTPTDLVQKDSTESQDAELARWVTRTPRPAWATETAPPEVIHESMGFHTTRVVVGDFGVLLNQYVHQDGITLEPVTADLTEFWKTEESGTREMFDGDAQKCRDLASALLKAATIIDDNNA